MARHMSLAEQLKGVLEYRNRPVDPVEPVKTNFTPVAANDNNPEDLAGLHIERRRSMRPTEREIMEQVRIGPVEYGQYLDDNDKPHRVVTRIGNLRFSDGSQTERAFKRSIDGKLIEYDAPMPVGAMLHTRDRQERVLGGDTVTSNAAYTCVYGGKHPGTATRKSKEQREAETPAPFRSKAQMRDEIAALPSHGITYCKDGFPWKPSILRELFMGLEKGKKGETGSVAWEDISTHIVEREAWAEAVASLSAEDITTLDASMMAKTMREIGEAHGFSGKRAERMGKKILRASNDNLAVALKKFAA